jgi:hypothetical protein
MGLWLVTSPASDIDLLVLLSQPFNYFDELRRIIELLYPIQLESDQLISARPVPPDEFEDGASNSIETRKEKGDLCDLFTVFDFSASS